MKTALRIVISFLGLFIILFLIAWNIRPLPKEVKDWEVVVSEEALEHGLYFQFLGNTNILVGDEHTRILTDGFFSRPSASEILFGAIAPDENEVLTCLNQAGIEYLSAVIPLHSHYDHAMDAPLVADKTNAQLIGSPSTMNIAKGYGLDDSKMLVPSIGETLQIGDMQLRFVESDHWPYPDEKQRRRLLDLSINEPLVPPASIYDYKEGISYGVLMRKDNYSWAIHGSAGFAENAYVGEDVDILFLAVAGLETMDDDFNETFQQHVVEALNPEVIVPIHWDDFTVPLNKGLKTHNLVVRSLIGNDLQKALEILKANNPERQIKMMPLWTPVSVEDLLD